MTEQLAEHVDILIIGAGPVGMTLHLVAVYRGRIGEAGGNLVLPL